MELFGQILMILGYTVAIGSLILLLVLMSGPDQGGLAAAATSMLMLLGLLVGLLGQGIRNHAASESPKLEHESHRPLLLS
jgi:hypothetical protein